MKNTLALLFILPLLTACQVYERDRASTNQDQAIVAEFLTIDITNLPNYTPQFPIHYDAGIQNQLMIPFNNRISNEGATLGRVLFYDKQLSINGTISCASCHQQSRGFSDSRVRSLGFDGERETGAHSMRLGNVGFYSGLRMFWNKRAPSLEAQSTEPIKDDIEMGFDEAHGGFAALIQKMENLPYYPPLFRIAFETEQITEQRVQLALAQFMRAMVSVNSRFDTGAAQAYNPTVPGRGVNAPFPTFTAEENAGKNLFIQGPGAGGFGCASCHQPPTFRLDANSLSNGLDEGETVIFKSPSLKNIALDGAFMHDGRFTTLEDAIRHYSTGIQMGPALDPRLRNGGPGPGGPGNNTPLQFNMTDDQVNAIVAFLGTLTDEVLINDVRFSDPFKTP